MITCCLKLWPGTGRSLTFYQGIMSAPSLIWRKEFSSTLGQMNACHIVLFHMFKPESRTNRQRGRRPQGERSSAM